MQGGGALFITLLVFSFAGCETNGDANGGGTSSGTSYSCGNDKIGVSGVALDGYYYIYDVKGLQEWASSSDVLTSNVILGSCLNLSEIDNWEPVATGFSTYTSNTYKGIFDGNYHTIYNLSIAGDYQRAGFIGGINGGSVKNLTLSNPSINITYTGSGTAYYGAIASTINGDGTVENCHVFDGTISIDNSSNVTYYGSIAGSFAGSTVYGCIVSGGTISIKGDAGAYAGGIVGNSSSTTSSIKSCTNSAAITAETIGNSSSGGAYAGGIVGRFWGTVANCTNSGNITGKGNTTVYGAGIVALNSGTITTCTNSGNITVQGNETVVYGGGIVGYNAGTYSVDCANNGGTINASGSDENIGTISGYDAV